MLASAGRSLYVQAHASTPNAEHTRDSPVQRPVLVLLAKLFQDERPMCPEEGMTGLLSKRRSHLIERRVHLGCELLVHCQGVHDCSKQ